MSGFRGVQGPEAGRTEAAGGDSHRGRQEPDRPDAADRLERCEQIARVLPRWELVATYRLRELARRHQLSTNEFLVVTELLFRPDGLIGAHLAELVGLGSGGMTGILARLEERDLVERSPDPSDGRQVVVAATVEARMLLWDDLVGTDVRYLLQGMDERAVRAVSTFVDRAADHGFRQVQRAHDRRRR